MRFHRTTLAMDMRVRRRQTSADFDLAGLSTEYAMVHLDDFIDDGSEDGDEGPDVAADFAALKGCLKALADAIASTNLAVLNGAQGDAAAATQRVQASVGALKRFHDAFKILDSGAEDDAEPADEDA